MARNKASEDGTSDMGALHVLWRREAFELKIPQFTEFIKAEDWDGRQLATRKVFAMLMSASEFMLRAFQAFCGPDWRPVLVGGNFREQRGAAYVEGGSNVPYIFEHSWEYAERHGELRMVRVLGHGGYERMLNWKMGQLDTPPDARIIGMLNIAPAAPPAHDVAAASGEAPVESSPAGLRVDAAEPATSARANTPRPACGEVRRFRAAKTFFICWKPSRTARYYYPATLDGSRNISTEPNFPGLNRPWGSKACLIACIACRASAPCSLSRKRSLP